MTRRDDLWSKEPGSREKRIVSRMQRGKEMAG